MPSAQAPTIRPAYDAVVIGGGLGGLTCANYLARAGKSVLLVEAQRYPGGCCCTFGREGFRFDAGPHYMGAGDRWGIAGAILRELKASPPAIRCDPAEHIHLGARTWAVPSDVEAWERELGRSFPDQTSGLRAFFEELPRVFRALSAADSAASAYAGSTFEDLVSRFVDDPALARVLGAEWPNVGLPPARASALLTGLMLHTGWSGGAWHPRGGMGRLSEALGAAFAGAGGDLVLGCRVARIACRSGGVRGVVLEDGREVAAGVVVSNLDPRTAFLRLLEEPAPAEWAARLRAWEPSGSAFVLYVGADTNPAWPRDAWGYYHPEEERTDFEWLYVARPSLLDASLAPEGCEVIEVIRQADPARMPGKAEERKASKREWTERSLDDLERILPGVRERARVVEAATPATFERYTGNGGGACFGWAATPAQAGRGRMPPRSPIRGLWSVGHWTRPGPGLCGAIASGKMVARAILAEQDGGADRQAQGERTDG